METADIVQEERSMAIEEKISAHETIREMYGRLHEAGLTNVVDRFMAQELTRCPYCMQGISCQLCSNGPRWTSVFWIPNM